VVEVVTDYRGDAFRSVYTVQFADGVYVLHVFQKKSKTGRTTLRGDLDLVRLRLKEAERMAKEMKP